MPDFLTWLQSEHDKIMNCEKEAHALMQKDDMPGYRQKMQEKAQLLANLAKAASGHMASLSPQAAAMIQQTLESYSANANTALQLDSVFYMSALLYKDDHGRDEPDNLQQFIDKLAREGIK